MTLPVIDLGDVSGVPPDRPERRGRLLVGEFRRLLLAVLAGVCALALGASARPVPPQVHELWSTVMTESDQIGFDGETLYMHRFSGWENLLSAVDAATGTARWTRSLSKRVFPLESVGAAGVILMPGTERTARATNTDGSTSLLTFSTSVIAIDPATGRDLWERPGGYEYAVSHDHMLLTDRGDQGLLTKARLVHARTGTVVWERDLPGAEEYVLEYQHGTPVRMAVVTLDGTVTVLNYADGVPLLTARIPWDVGAAANVGGSSMVAAAGLLLVNRTAAGTGSVTAYRIDTLERLWSRSGNERTSAHDCGPVVCLVDVASFEALDPRTGALRWTGPGFPSAFSTRSGAVLLTNDAGYDPETVLRDATTGRQRGSAIRGWAVYPEPRAGHILYLHNEPPDPRPAAVRRLDLATGEITLLGEIPLVGSGRCSNSGRYLACYSAGRLVISTISGG